LPEHSANRAPTRLAGALRWFANAIDSKQDDGVTQSLDQMLSGTSHASSTIDLDSDVNAMIDAFWDEGDASKLVDDLGKKTEESFFSKFSAEFSNVKALALGNASVVYNDVMAQVAGPVNELIVQVENNVNECVEIVGTAAVEAKVYLSGRADDDQRSALGDIKNVADMIDNERVNLTEHFNLPIFELGMQGELPPAPNIPQVDDLLMRLGFPQRPGDRENEEGEVEVKDDFVLEPEKMATNLGLLNGSTLPFVYEKWRKHVHALMGINRTVQTYYEFIEEATYEYTPVCSQLIKMNEFVVPNNHLDDTRADLHNTGKTTRIYTKRVRYELLTTSVRRPMRPIFIYKAAKQAINYMATANGVCNVEEILEFTQTRTVLEISPELAAQAISLKSFCIDSTASQSYASLNNIIMQNVSLNIPYAENYHHHVYANTMQYCFALREKYMWEHYMAGTIPFH